MCVRNGQIVAVWDRSGTKYPREKQEEKSQQTHRQDKHCLMNTWVHVLETILPRGADGDDGLKPKAGLSSTRDDERQHRKQNFKTEAGEKSRSVTPSLSSASTVVMMERRGLDTET